MAAGAAGAADERTMVDGDAVRKKNAGGPAHRHAAQSASSTSAAGGPHPNHDFSGSTATPAGVPASSSTTHPRTLRPCNGARTRVPTSMSSRHAGGTE